jgi:hypothetical protein
MCIVRYLTTSQLGAVVTWDRGLNPPQEQAGVCETGLVGFRATPPSLLFDL